MLSAALTRAVREELIPRNVARLVELPQWQRGAIRPWTADEAWQFLAAAKTDPLYTAFVLLILYACAVARASACAGLTSTSTRARSRFASRSSASRAA